MSLKDVEDKSVETQREASIPAQFTKEYAKFLAQMASETDPESLGQLQVKFGAILRHMAAAKVYIPPAWADAANACGDKASRIRTAEFVRRNQ